MTDTVQPGAEVDAALWSRFREAVERQTGGVRGHLRSELETALRLYLADEGEVSAVQINQRLGRIESELGIAEADGGADAVAPEPHTHAPSGYDPETDGKPSANASTDKKVAYLAAQVGDTPDQIARAALRKLVKEEYGFRRDTAKRYVERLTDHFDLVAKPDDDDFLVSEERYDELLEQRRADLEAEADAELEVTDR